MQETSSTKNNPCNITAEEYFNDKIDLQGRDIGRPKETSTKNKAATLINILINLVKILNTKLGVQFGFIQNRSRVYFSNNYSEVVALQLPTDILGCKVELMKQEECFDFLRFRNQPRCREEFKTTDFLHFHTTRTPFNFPSSLKVR